MARFEIDTEYLVQVLTDLIETPSPTGDTSWVTQFVANELSVLGVEFETTRKGALRADMKGLRDQHRRALTAHVDTLGAMVSEIKSSGRLKLKALNGLMWPTVESEGVTIKTRGDTQIRGSIVFENGSAHVNPEARKAVRTAENLEVRIDERTNSAEETRLLGIEVGDYVYIDPRFERTSSGFLRGRFLDDKAGAAAILAAIKALRQEDVSPARTTHLLFSNFEEVGHGGMDGLPAELAEYVVVDMACVGSGQNGDEFHCSVCLADGGGPYSKGLTEKIRNIAEKAGIDLKPDTYKSYSSDGTAYWRSGGTAEVALIGPGVDTSHGYERTHLDAVRDTATLIAEYLVED